jgi:uncharacterized protein YjdB
VAKVSSAGVVTGVATGNAVITATSEGKSATAKVVVQVPVASVSVTPTSVSLRETCSRDVSSSGRRATRRWRRWMATDS